MTKNENSRETLNIRFKSALIWIIQAFGLVLTYEILEDGRIDDVTIIDFASFCVNPLAPKGD